MTTYGVPLTFYRVPRFCILSLHRQNIVLRWLKRNIHRVLPLKAEITGLLESIKSAFSKDDQSGGIGAMMAMLEDIRLDIVEPEESRWTPMFTNLTLLDQLTLKIQSIQDGVDQLPLKKMFQVEEIPYLVVTEDIIPEQCEFNPSMLSFDMEEDERVHVEDLQWDQWEENVEDSSHMILESKEPQELPLSAEEILKVEDLCEKITVLEEDNFLASQTQLLHDDIVIFLVTDSFEKVCEQVHVSQLSDITLLKLSELLMTDQLSYTKASKWVHLTLFPRVASLKTQASRTLMSTLILSAKSHANALTESVFLPVLTLSEFGVQHSETIFRVIKEAYTPETVSRFLNSISSLPWSDTFLDLIPKVILIHPNQSQDVLFNLLTSLETQFERFRESKKALLKISTLLFHIVNKCHEYQHRAQLLRKIAQECGTHMSQKVLHLLDSK